MHLANGQVAPFMGGGAWVGARCWLGGRVCGMLKSTRLTIYSLFNIGAITLRPDKYNTFSFSTQKSKPFQNFFVCLAARTAFVNPFLLFASILSLYHNITTQTCKLNWGVYKLLPKFHIFLIFTAL